MCIVASVTAGEAFGVQAIAIKTIIVSTMKDFSFHTVQILTCY
jgi:hypothetical protein